MYRVGFVSGVCLLMVLSASGYDSMSTLGVMQSLLIYCGCLVRDLSTMS